jgi:hypothetical protein
MINSVDIKIKNTTVPIKSIIVIKKAKPAEIVLTI